MNSSNQITVHHPHPPTIASTDSIAAIIAKQRENIFSDDPTAQLYETQIFRKLLSIETNLSIQYVVDAGVIPRLVQFLNAQHNLTLQYEATMVLTSISMGNVEQTRHIIDAGAIPAFIQLLSSSHDDIREQSIRAIGNLASQSMEYRDVILNHGALPKLLYILETFTENTHLSIIRSATWTLSKLCQRYHLPNDELGNLVLPVLTKLILNIHDWLILKYACEGLCALTSGFFLRYDDIIDIGIGPRLIDLLQFNILPLQIAALRIITFIATGDEDETKYLHDIGILPVLLSLLDHPDKDFREDICWTLSHLSNGNSDLIQTAINCGVFIKFIELSYVMDSGSQIPMLEAFQSIICSKNIEQIFYIVQLGMIGCICYLLTMNDVKVLREALYSLNLFLEMVHNFEEDDDISYLARNMILECNGWNNIEELQDHSDSGISSNAKTIFETYFNVEDIHGGLLK